MILDWPMKVNPWAKGYEKVFGSKFDWNQDYLEAGMGHKKR